MPNEALRQALIARAVRARALAERLIAQNVRHVGYHPEAEALHGENAAFLMQAFADHGWPGRAMVGDDGAAAAMLILQHAMGHPETLRRGLALMLEAIPQGQANALDAAYLSDRICVFEGRAQLYGTQLDWGEDGRLRPAPLAEPDNVDSLRAALGLGPLAEAVAATNADAERRGEGAPADLAERRAAFEAWAKRVGWRAA